MSYHLKRLQYETPKVEGFLPAPIVTITVSGAHDVGRMLEMYAHGNSEQAHLAYKLQRRLRRTRQGKATLRYLQSHGGGKWYSPPRTRKSA